MEEITIRVAQPADAAALAKIYEQTWDVAFATILTEEQLAEALAYADYWGKQAAQWEAPGDWPRQAFVICVAGRPVGFSFARVEIGIVGVVVMLCVRPAFQKLGFGKQLVKETARGLQNLGARHLALSTYSKGEATIRFYRKLGGSGAPKHQAEIVPDLGEDGDEPSETKIFWPDISTLVKG